MSTAELFLKDIKQITKERCQHPWELPLINTLQGNGTVFEWWSGSKKITIYHYDTHVDWMKIDDQLGMPSGILENPDSFSDLWDWLHQ